MSLEKILDRIGKDAQNEADRIKNRASASVDETIKKAQEEAENLKAQGLEDAKNAAEQRKERIISTARLDFRKALLAEKQRAIDNAFQEAVDSLIRMNDNEYRKIIRSMILSNVQTGDEEIILSKRDKSRLGNNFVKDVNRQLAKNGGKGNLTLSKETYNMAGGFILRRGKIELNSTFGTLFKSSRDELESEVSKILFPEPSED
jgi:V/A-type H+-transporting ATPase subunit E